jgi:nitrogenase molybdenum-iron protein NifN
VTVAVASGDSPQLAGLPAARVLVGDLEDAEELRDEFDLIVGNGHVEALAHRHHKGVVLRGFPDWETLGNQLKHDVLYEGGAYFLFEVANAAERMRHNQGLTHKTA